MFSNKDDVKDGSLLLNDFIAEDSNAIIDLLTIIDMSIQINIQKQSESNEIMSILNQKGSQNKSYPKSSTRIRYYPQTKKISIAGRVIFKPITQNSTKLILIENNYLKSYNKDV